MCINAINHERLCYSGIITVMHGLSLLIAFIRTIPEDYIQTSCAKLHDVNKSNHNHVVSLVSSEK